MKNIKNTLIHCEANMKDYIKIILIFTILILILIFVPGLDGEQIKVSKLYINEIASSQRTIKDIDSEYSDYIEIYNGYNYDINLFGYYLSDDEYYPKKWSFPNVTIKSKEYLLVFASSKDKYDNEIHTNFKLSSSGEIITLTDNQGNIISKVNYKEQKNNVSFGYLNGKYKMMNPTPGKKNTDEIIRGQEDIKDKIIINEYITHNKSKDYNKTGNYYDWIELYNKTDKDITLGNVYLSDNNSNLPKFKIPNTVIKSKDYLVIYLSEEAVEGEIHANFKLSDNEQIVLSDGKKIYESINITKLPDNVSYGLKDNKWYYFTTPTPGKVNNTASFEKIGDYNGST